MNSLKISKIKPVTVKEKEKIENSYILAYNELNYTIVAQSYNGKKNTAKEKNATKLLYENFIQKTIELNTVYARHIYIQLQPLFEQTDLDAIEVYFIEEEEKLNRYYDYFIEAKNNKGELIYNNKIENDVANKFLENMDDFFEESCGKLYIKSSANAVVLIRDITFLEFLEFFDLEHMIGFNIDISLDDIKSEISSEEEVQESDSTFVEEE